MSAEAKLDKLLNGEIAKMEKLVHADDFDKEWWRMITQDRKILERHDEIMRLYGMVERNEERAGRYGYLGKLREQAADRRLGITRYEH
jgi:hypothetical protein